LFLTRLLTAAVLLAAFIAALYWLDHGLFALLISIVIGLGGYEWARLGKSSRALAAAYGAACTGICAALSWLPGLTPWLCGFAGLFWILAAPAWMAREFPAPRAAAAAAIGLVVLVPAGLATIALPRDSLLMVLGLTWIADTGAYLAGRAFGKHKLAPAISPGKTWEGVAGGAIGCLIYAIIWAIFVPQLQARVQGGIWILFLAGTMLLFALSVVGDLFESAAKRRAGVKDSGALLPGHGGILDRVDSATAVLPSALPLLLAIGMA
jgi:phosphatidate cytidylyltransferase